MKFFVDTADTQAIRELNELGMVDGVTTNPALLARESGEPTEILLQLCQMVSGASLGRTRPFLPRWSSAPETHSAAQLVG